jgi:hypothetical protein
MAMDITNTKEPFLVIPEHTSSLLAPTCRKRVKELSESSNQLKRKATTLLQQPPLSRTESIDIQLELSQANYEL